MSTTKLTPMQRQSANIDEMLLSFHLTKTIASTLRVSTDRVLQRAAYLGLKRRYIDDGEAKLLAERRKLTIESLRKQGGGK